MKNRNIVYYINKENNMKTNIDSSEYSTTFAALKLIEYIYHCGMIKKHVFTNILMEYSERIDVSQFKI